MDAQFDVLIVGGGTAGITVAAQLSRHNKQLKIGIIEPSEKHYYQPFWTLVGAGVVTLSDSVRDEASVVPPHTTWIKKSVIAFEPEQNSILCDDQTSYHYHYLVVCPGIQINWHKIEGLNHQLGRNQVCSIYDKNTVEKTWTFIKEFKGGTAIFTFPNTPIKCGGAPQKIMYLAEDYFRKHGVRHKSRVIFASAGASIFGVAKYRAALEKIIQSRGIETIFHVNLEKIDASTRTAYFRKLENNNILSLPYDLLHIAPPMSAPDFIKDSSLADQNGWVDVDKWTTRHRRYPNIFSLGDASNLPTAKTGAAIRKQAPVTVGHILADRQQTSCNLRYNGYSSCPLLTRYYRVILAEFDYDGNPVETFPFNQAKERYSMYLLKRYVLPNLYWHGMLKGIA